MSGDAENTTGYVEDFDAEAIRARLAAATPGEWLARGGCVSARNPQQGQGPGFTVQTELTPVCQMGAGDGWKGPQAEGDEALIANAPTDLAACLAHIETLHVALRQKDRDLAKATALVLSHEGRIETLETELDSTIEKRAERSLGTRPVWPSGDKETDDNE